MGIHDATPVATTENMSGIVEEGLITDDSLEGAPTTPAKPNEIEDEQLIGEGSSRKTRNYEESDPLRKSAVCLMVAFVAFAMLVSGGRMLGISASMLGFRIVPAGNLCSYADRNSCPADEFLVNPEVHEVATATLIEVANGFSTSLDWGMVKTIVVESFSNVRAGLAAAHPELDGVLKSIQITGMQKEAILELLRLIRNPRLQAIGLEISEVMRDNVGTPFRLKHHVQQKLYERREEIMALRHELISEPLLSFWGVGDEWSMTLNPDNVNMMESITGDWSAMIDGNLERLEKSMPHIHQAIANTDLMAQSDGVRGGVLEEGRVLLDMVEFLAHSLGKDVTMPRLAVSFSDRFGAGRFKAEQFRCDLQSKEISLWFLRSTLCLLKMGTQGVDALRAAPELMNVVPEVKTTSPELFRHEVVVPEEVTEIASHGVQALDGDTNNLGKFFEPLASEVAQ